MLVCLATHAQHLIRRRRCLGLSCGLVLRRDASGEGHVHCQGRRAGIQRDVGQVHAHAGAGTFGCCAWCTFGLRGRGFALQILCNSQAPHELSTAGKFAGPQLGNEVRVQAGNVLLPAPDAALGAEQANAAIGRSSGTRAQFLYL